MKHGDIYRWEYKQKELGKRGVYPYYAKSCIAIYDKSIDSLVDTYWQDGRGKTFSRTVAKNFLDLVYVANLNDLEPCDRAMFNNYDDKDCTDISHPNMTNNGFYIKMGAKQSIEKKRKVLVDRMKDAERKVRHYQKDIEYIAGLLDNLTNDMIV